MTLPLPIRNGLAALILDALHEPAARRTLAILANMRDDGGASVGEGDLPPGFPRAWFQSRHGRLALREGWTPCLAELTDRAGRARRALEARPPTPRHSRLADALAEAAVLFDAGLYFEVHELLEPHWMVAEGSARRALQGLIQVAVGFQHLANGNSGGGLGLLREGSAKVGGQRLLEVDLDPFAEAVRACAARSGEPAGAGAAAPPFPVSR